MNGLKRSDIIELAYGLLWTLEVDTQTDKGRRLSMARKALLGTMDKKGQARGITAARKEIVPPPNANAVMNCNIEGLIDMFKTAGYDSTKPDPASYADFSFVKFFELIKFASAARSAATSAEPWPTVDQVAEVINDECFTVDGGGESYVDGANAAAERIAALYAAPTPPPDAKALREALSNAKRDIASIHEKIGERGLLNQTAAIQQLCRTASDQIDAALASSAPVDGWRERTIAELERVLREVRRALDRELDPTALSFPTLSVQVNRALQISENASALARQQRVTP